MSATTLAPRCAAPLAPPALIPDSLAALTYDAFLDRKTHLGTRDGFDPGDLAVRYPHLFGFQAALVAGACHAGRWAVFGDCGLGKTPILLAWADAVVRRTNKPVLVLCPLAVAGQLAREAEKFGVPAVVSRDGRLPAGPDGADVALVVITNYEKLPLFDWQRFAGAVCDESGCLKNFDGERKTAITAFMRKLSYRLLTSATPAPNDYVELGTSSEALGYLGFMDMLGRYFKNDHSTVDTRTVYRLQGGDSRGPAGPRPQWRFKGHAEGPFWRWVASWARALRRPSDLGPEFADEDARYVLPALDECEHLIDDLAPADGELFALPAVGLAQQRAERSRTLAARCDLVASLTADTGEPALVWAHTNAEAERLTASIPGAVEVRGHNMRDEEKEERLLAFAAGQARVLVTKPRIGAWGLNFQHCAHVTWFPSHSYEQYYQAVRRCWRFGQTRAVHVDLIATPGDAGVAANQRRKAQQADRMFQALVASTRDALTPTRSGPMWRPSRCPRGCRRVQSAGHHATVRDLPARLRGGDARPPRRECGSLDLLAALRRALRLLE